jgi:hypothetical protein
MTSATSRLAPAQLVGGGLLELGVTPRTTGGPTGAASRTGSSATYSGCDRLRDDEIAEHRVDEVDDRAGGAEVPREAARRGAGAGGPEERRDVGAPEPVDRLLGVPTTNSAARSTGSSSQR